MGMIEDSEDLFDFSHDHGHNHDKTEVKPRKYEVVYTNLLTFGYGHIGALYGLYLACTVAKWTTIFFALGLYYAGILGITAGAHRLWSHRTYKAKMPLQIILMILNTIAFQNTAYTWIRDHRLHHKYSDTDADPHNATRGFFFSHVGWLLVRKHEDVKKYGKLIDMSDIENNPVLRFQKKYALPWCGMVCFVLPTLIPMYCWGESLNCAWHIAVVLRYVANLNVTFLVNSAAHIWGYKPYDKNMLPGENISVAIASFGEGFHNYHHTFPWDYRAAELGNNRLNLTTAFIDFFASIGWAYDLKSVTKTHIEARKKRTGDGSNFSWLDKETVTEDQKDR
uniref:Desaturase-14 n=1 Tax=Plutella xylostella TaxID=51655 RepID=A0A1L8D6L2_PLUXY